MSNATPKKMLSPRRERTAREGFFNKRLLEVILGDSQDGVLVVDWLGNMRRVNQTLCSMLGYGPAELEGKNILRFLRQWKGDADFFDAMVEEIWFSGFWQGEISIHRRDSLVFQARLRVNAILPTQTGESVRFYVGQLTRLSDALTLSRSTVPNSSLDPLTGLANRLLFEDRLQQALTQARRRNRSVVSMFVDLDRFKLINDSLGPVFGDRLLVEVTERLIHCLRTSDSVARIGADEFALLLTDLDDGSGAIRNAGVVARKVYETLSLPLSIDGQETEVSAAMGITLFPQDGDDAQEIMKNTYTALAHAKKKGRNSYQFFSAEMTETARRRFDLENRLRHAVERGEMRLYYQPQVDLKTGKVIGAEALVRWMQEGDRLVSPAEFIPVAEESGLIVPIGEWVLKTACQQIAAWREMGLPSIRVGVNLSAVQFRRQDLAAIVEALLAEYKIEPSQLDLEITESAIMEDVQRAVKILNRISDLGVKLSIDDFGTGYSSLSQLRQFPFKTLKIDRSFVRDISSNPGDAAIVSAIIAMAHSLDQTVVVEGLETTDQLTILRNLRCNEMQGFLFSAAIPADELTALLIEGRQLQTE
ncbi:MAG: EAL domain-containing protein [Magnetococcales bacterium]|nr:EAL domain-containing protein [Magnetococcales bacterium]